MMPHSARVRRQAGYALIEVAGTLSIVGLLLTMAAVVLHRSMQSHQLALQQLQRPDVRPLGQALGDGGVGVDYGGVDAPVDLRPEELRLVDRAT